MIDSVKRFISAYYGCKCAKAFYIKYQGLLNPLLGQIQPKPLPVLIRDENEDENYEEWTVKQIINSKYFGKGRGRRLYYKATYTGFDIDQPEWQLWEDFKNVKDLISDFYYANPQKPGLSRDFVPNPLWEPSQLNRCILPSRNYSDKILRNFNRRSKLSN